MGFLFVDVAVFAMNLYFAIVHRGTVLGWLATAIVFFYVWVVIKSIREI
jgi:hypothetical protein